LVKNEVENRETGKNALFSTLRAHISLPGAFSDLLSWAKMFSGVE